MVDKLQKDMESAAIDSFSKFDQMWKRGHGLSHEGHSVILQAISAYAELRKAAAMERIADALESPVESIVPISTAELAAIIKEGQAIFNKTDTSITDAVSEHKRTCYCQTTYPSEAQARECAASHI